MKSFPYTEKLQKLPILLSYFARVYCGLFFIHYHRVLLEEDMNRRRRSPGICFEGNPGYDRRARRLTLATIAVGKPGTFIYMDSNLASADRPTMIAVRKPQLYTPCFEIYHCTLTYKLMSRIQYHILSQFHSKHNTYKTLNSMIQEFL